MLYQYGDLADFRETLWEAEKLLLPKDTVGFHFVTLMRECRDVLAQVHAKAGNKRIMPAKHREEMDEFFHQISSFNFLKGHKIEDKPALYLKIKKR